MSFWQTGSDGHRRAGFLGSFVVDRLRQLECDQVFVPKRRLQLVRRGRDPASSRMLVPTSSFISPHALAALVPTSSIQPSFSSTT